jgi:hypothetical protein
VRRGLKWMLRMPYFMLCSHRRSDQFDRPDHIYSPMKPDQTGLNAHSRLLHDLESTLHDVLRLLLDDNPTNIPTSSRSTRPIREPYTISTRLTGPLLDRCQISRNVGGSTQVPVRAWNNARKGTWGLPPPVKLERRDMTYNVSMWRKNPKQTNKKSTRPDRNDRNGVVNSRVSIF